MIQSVLLLLNETKIIHVCISRCINELWYMLKWTSMEKKINKQINVTVQMDIRKVYIENTVTTIWNS